MNPVQSASRSILRSDWSRNIHHLGLSLPISELEAADSVTLRSLTHVIRCRNFLGRSKLLPSWTLDIPDVCAARAPVGADLSSANRTLRIPITEEWGLRTVASNANTRHFFPWCTNDVCSRKDPYMPLVCLQWSDCSMYGKKSRDLLHTIVQCREHQLLVDSIAPNSRVLQSIEDSRSMFFYYQHLKNIDSFGRCMIPLHQPAVFSLRIILVPNEYTTAV